MHTHTVIRREKEKRALEGQIGALTGTERQSDERCCKCSTFRAAVILTRRRRLNDCSLFVHTERFPSHAACRSPSTFPSSREKFVRGARDEHRAEQGRRGEAYMALLQTHRHIYSQRPARRAKRCVSRWTFAKAESGEQGESENEQEEGESKERFVIR